MNIDGRCHCGYIRFEADADPDKAMPLYRLSERFRLRIGNKSRGRSRQRRVFDLASVWSVEMQ